jgi:DNA-binding NtrC family response regulator
MAALLLLSGPSAGTRHEIKGEVIIGRSPSCTILLEDAKVSRRHVRIVVEGGQARVSDLGSRNGTVVNGEKVETEVVMLPGDRLQVGDTTALFEPPTRAAFNDRATDEDASALPVEELVPVVGPAAGLYSAGVALLSATSEAMVLRRAAEELARGVSAEVAAALLGGSDGLLTAAVVGADKVEVPRTFVRAALEKKEVGRSRGTLCAPMLASGGAPYGILYAERPEPFTEEDQRTIAALGRLAGEAFTSARARLGAAGAVVPLVGASRAFRKSVEQARRAASTDVPTFISGESGSGRTQFARYIHSRSARALGPFILVDCRAAPVSLEEQLFGRTSAPGIPPASSALLNADGGTLLLQHADALPRPLMERVSRLIQLRVAPARQGGEESIDVRFMATASERFEVLTGRGEFEPDLAKVLSACDLETLPLRERRPDVLLLFEHFAGNAARSRRKEAPVLSPEARRLMLDYGWPGNVEELKGVAERLELLNRGGELPALRLPPEIQEGSSGGTRSLAQMIARLERDAIAEALREARGKKIKAAALLGISRPTLDKKIADYEIVVEKRRA